MAVAFYLPLGSPQLGDFPLAERARTPDATQPLDNLVAQVEQHLEKNPTDGRGWTVLAPVLARLGRFDEAVRAYRNSITYNGDSAERRADLGEAMAGAAGGVVTAGGQGRIRARRRAERGRGQGDVLPRACGRAGRPPAGGRVDLARDARKGAAERAVASAGPGRPGAGRRFHRAGACRTTRWPRPKDMNEADRSAMIRSMVERLASRLKQNGDDVEGWLRLVRAYMVMGDRDKARSALSDARQAVANDAERLRQLNEGLKNLGLDG